MIFAVSSIFIVPLLRVRGFDDSQIGVLIAIRSISAICISPVIASFLDRYPKFQIKVMLLILLGINIVNTIIFQYVSLNFWGTVIIFIVLGATTNTMPSLHSAMAMKFNDKYNQRKLVYSFGRGVGSVAYAVISLVLGMLVTESNYGLSLTIQIGLDVFSILVLLLFPSYVVGERQKAADAGKQKEAHGNLYLLKHYPRFTLFLIASVFVFVGYSMLNSFMIDVIVDRGGDSSDLGVSCFILGIAELPTALIFPKLKKKFGTRTLLNVSAVFATLKMIALYLSPNVVCVWRFPNSADAGKRNVLAGVRALCE